MIQANAIEAGTYRIKATQGADLDAHLGQVTQYLQSLPPELFPHITSMAGSLTSGDIDERFEFGINVFLRGLEAHIEK
ncbi:TetR/AcrR family transcriptional regulator C-terminal domain-containing protein [Nonomuraea basaltis]|uniref:TetR/AcrR family transcriptional regulator C-terminal domain-containing protein n=1 Tax=Nonomuraea basaltis TaxID=2495887 RepID=UPI00110C6930|nr:TetR/AcrR family transcriptional regulator C-terminal domain-containing protein [Nonomuraea basaltis]TMR88411.1 hypothetical protein EJK15_66375 [Nonomuraea basaltis]